MQRFRLLKLYLFAVLFVLTLAITGMAWLRPSQDAVIGPEADPLPNGVNGTHPSNDDGLTHPDAMQQPVAEKFRDSME